MFLTIVVRSALHFKNTRITRPRYLNNGTKTPVRIILNLIERNKKR